MTSSKTNNIDPARWVEAYGDRLYSYAYSRLSSKELAEDMVQETFLAALHSKENFRGESKENTWLFSILKRKIIDHYRKKTIVRESYDQNADSHFIQEGEQKGQWNKARVPKDWEKHFTTEAETEEFYRILDFCLSLIPEKWSAVFRWKTMEELSTPQICKEMGISSSNFWVIMHRARLRLRECFENNWFE